MHLKLIYRSPELGAAWLRHFKDREEVEVLAGDICQVACDALVSPANSFGFMDGGLDLAISERFGWDLEKRLQAKIAQRPLRELLVGEALLVKTNDEHLPWLISAPTMRVPMRLRQSVNAYLAMKAILNVALAAEHSHSISTVAIPGLGTGVGGLSATTAAFQMWMAFQEIVLGEFSFPRTFADAQGAHFGLNPAEINFWDD